MWVGAMKNLSHAKSNEAKAANNQSSIITNHLEGKPISNPIQTQSPKGQK